MRALNHADELCASRSKAEDRVAKLQAELAVANHQTEEARVQLVATRDQLEEARVQIDRLFLTLCFCAKFLHTHSLFQALFPFETDSPNIANEFLPTIIKYKHYTTRRFARFAGTATYPSATPSSMRRRPRWKTSTPRRSPRRWTYRGRRRPGPDATRRSAGARDTCCSRTAPPSPVALRRRAR